MSKINRRSHPIENPSSPSYKQNPAKKQRHQHNAVGDGSPAKKSESDRQFNPQQEKGKCNSFVSYLERPDLHPNLRILCEIITRTPASGVEKALDDTHLRVCQQDVEEVLKLSYGYPSAALNFFRWAGCQLGDKHSPYSWNLIVDLLGRNMLFDAMWDAIKFMRSKGLLSLATFASVFSSYVSADNTQEAFRAFRVMEQYGCKRDVVALNSLLSSICRNGKTEKADEFLRAVKGEVKPDADSFAILLEGWECEGNVASARKTFGEMVVEIGWDPGNTAAYDSFLCTMLKGTNGLHEAMKLLKNLRERRCKPGFRFFRFALEGCVRKKDARGASLLWEAMTVRTVVARPDAHLYNLMIWLHCDLNNPDIAARFLDNMVYDGAFPDSNSYNVLLHSFIKCRKLRDALAIFTEMRKNEFLPSCVNCMAGVRMCLDMGDPCSAVKFWKFMIAKYDRDLGETGNLLIMGLMDHKMIPQAVEYAEDMVDRGIKLSSAMLTTLKDGLGRTGMRSLYNELLNKLDCINRSRS